MNVVVARRTPAEARAVALMLEQQDDITVLAELSDEGQILRVVSDTRPDLVLIDPELARVKVADLVERLAATVPSAGVVILTGSADPAYVSEAVQAGARGYISMDTEPDDVIRLLRQAAKGPVLAPAGNAANLSDLVADVRPGQDSLEPESDLTEREIEVVDLVVRGATNRQIAEDLVITENTVKVHLRNIFRKLEVRNRQQLSTKAFQSGLVDNAEVELIDP